LHDVSGEAEDSATTGGGRWAALFLAIAVPASAIGLYLHIGHSEIIPRLQLAASQPTGLPPGHPAGEERPSLDELVARLAQRMEQDPDNVDGWIMLGRSYLAVGRPDQAATALERAYRLAPEEPDVLISYAQAVAAAQGGSLQGRPEELIRSALTVDPNNINARFLEGLIAYQGERFTDAAARWQALLALVDPQSEDATELREAIAEARARAGESGETAPPSGAEQASETPSAPSADASAVAMTAEPAAVPTGEAATSAVTVEVSLAEPLWPKANVNDTVFVYAKAATGPPMPLAVKQAKVGDLPIRVTLDDSMAMMPAMRLSAFPEVIVGARISRTGLATPQSGDFEGEVGPVTPGQPSPVAVLIDHTRP
jgi:cytochrome c-type biogenesis protein CcmH